MMFSNLKPSGALAASVAALFALTFTPGTQLFGQGLKITNLKPPVSKAGYTVPMGVNATGAVVGSYISSSTGNREGFLYSAGKYTVINPPTADKFSRANGINDTGEIVGDFLTSDNRYHGFMYSSGTYTTYDETSTESCGIFGINSTGDFAGDVGDGPVRAFVNIKGVKTEFTPTGAVNAYAYAINTSDEVVGTYYDSSNNAHGFSWVTTGTVTQITYPGAVQTNALGINDAGEITGTYTNTSGLTYGFTLVKGTYTQTDFADTAGVNKTGAYAGYYWGVPDGLPAGYLATPQHFTLTKAAITGGKQGAFNGINNAGAVVGGYVDTAGKSHGMMISSGVVTNIDDPKGVSTVCRGINATNQVVGVYYDTSGYPHGFLWSAGTFTDIIGTTGSLFSEATGINDSGDIVGDYYNPSIGSFHGFLLKGGVYQDLAVSGAVNTFGGGINATDEVTLWWTDSAGYRQSVLYNGTTYTTINVPGMAQSQASGINTTGQIAYVVSDPYNVVHAAVKKGTVYSIIDFPKGSQTQGGGINDSSEFVGSFIPAGQTVPQPYTGK